MLSDADRACLDWLCERVIVCVNVNVAAAVMEPNETDVVSFWLCVSLKVKDEVKDSVGSTVIVGTVRVASAVSLIVTRPEGDREDDGDREAKVRDIVDVLLMDSCNESVIFDGESLAENGDDHESLLIEGDDELVGDGVKLRERDLLSSETDSDRVGLSDRSREMDRENESVPVRDRVDDLVTDTVAEFDGENDVEGVHVAVRVGEADILLTDRCWDMLSLHDMLGVSDADLDMGNETDMEGDALWDRCGDTVRDPDSVDERLVHDGVVVLLDDPAKVTDSDIETDGVALRDRDASCVNEAENDSVAERLVLYGVSVREAEACADDDSDIENVSVGEREALMS